jgi:cell wall-associated NlpC family hydrolase
VIEGIAQVQVRIAQIHSSFPTAATSTAAGSAAVGTTSSGNTFAAALNQATAATGRAAATGGGTGSAVVSAAKKYLGVPYVWGGTDPARGLDCSGLVQRAYADLGIKLPRVSRDQAKAGTPVASLAQAKPGDLLAFHHPVDHIGIYIGDGKMIHAPRPGKDVQIVKVYETPTAIRRIVADGATAGTSAGPAGIRAAGSSAVPYGDLFTSAAARHGVPSALLAAVAKAESHFNPNAVSPAGARGLMQIMPGTARELGVNPMDPAQAVEGAAKLLAKHLRAYDGSIPLALAAYNAGPGAVRKYGGVPPYAETQNYVSRVQKYMTEMRP